MAHGSARPFSRGRSGPVGGVGHDLLQRQRFQAQVQRPGPGAVDVVQRTDHHHRLPRCDPPPVPDRPPGGELRHRDGGAAHAGRAAAQIVGGRFQHDVAAVDHHHLFQQAGGLVDQVGGQQHRAGVLGVVGE
jgi:hypothetical protein